VINNQATQPRRVNSNGGQQLTRQIGLQARKPQFALPVVLNEPLHGSVAEITNTVKKEDGMVRRHT